jgi:EmrB/QacA subfamily drug resistance transporter
MASIRLNPARGRALPGPGGTASKGLVLGIILTCYLMIVLDTSVIITALPDIHSALHFSSADLSWVQNAYTLVFGGLLLLGARAGDLLGRRRMFVIGIAIFTAASLLGGLAQSSTELLAARAVQGIGAAIAAPSTLALLTITFSEGRERTRALSLYAAVAGGGGSVGLVLGGMLTDWVSWRWGLFINVPIGIALVWLAPKYLPETERHTGRFDLMGAITSTLGMSALVYGFVRAGSDGWGDTVTLASFVSAVVLLAAFVMTELRAEQPITPLHLFKNRERVGAYLARMMVVSGLFSTFFFLTQYLQGVTGFNPLQAGLAFLPMTLVMFSMGRILPRIADRLTPMQLMIGGLALALAGIGWLSRISDGTAYFPEIALPLVLLGLGMGTAFAPLTAAGMAGVAPRDAGAASGLVNVAQQLGGSLGLGILVTVFASASRHAADNPIAGATAALQARHDLAHAVSAALTGSTIFLALALGVVVFLMRRPPAKEVAVAVASQVAR